MTPAQQSFERSRAAYETVRRLETRAKAEADAITMAEAEFKQATFDFEQGTLSGGELAEARESLSHARERLDHTRAALEVARARHETAKAQQKIDAIEERVEAAEALHANEAALRDAAVAKLREAQAAVDAWLPAMRELALSSPHFKTRFLDVEDPEMRMAEMMAHVVDRTARRFMNGVGQHGEPDLNQALAGMETLADRLGLRTWPRVVPEEPEPPNLLKRARRAVGSLLGTKAA